MPPAGRGASQIRYKPPSEPMLSSCAREIDECELTITDTEGGTVAGTVLWCGLRRVKLSTTDFQRNVLRLSAVSGLRATVGAVKVSRVVVSDGYGSVCEFSFSV